MLLRRRICYPRLRAAVPTELDYKNPDLLIGTLTRLFINEGRAREVAVLAYAKAELVQTGYDNWDGGIYDFEIQLEVPHSLYIQLGDDVDAIQDLIADRTRTMLRVYRRDRLDKVIIFAELAAAPGWQGDARAWLSGSGVTNQRSCTIRQHRGPRGRRSVVPIRTGDQSLPGTQSCRSFVCPAASVRQRWSRV